MFALQTKNNKKRPFSLSLVQVSHMFKHSGFLQILIKNQTAFLRWYCNSFLDLSVATIYPEELCNTGLYEVHHNNLFPAVLVLGVLFFGLGLFGRFGLVWFWRFFLSNFS